MIRIETKINAELEKVWDYWTNPKHIVNWYFASDDWHAPYAENDLTVEGRFLTTMSAKDKSFSFDFTGYYTKIIANQLIEFVIDDGRKVSVEFLQSDNKITLVETFEPESQNTEELQRAGWQAILDNFKKYVEAN